MNMASYTPQFKQKAVSAINGGMSFTQASKKFGVAMVTLRNWVKDTTPRTYSLHALQAPQTTPTELELAKLRAENRTLKIKIADMFLSGPTAA